MAFGPDRPAMLSSAAMRKARNGHDVRRHGRLRQTRTVRIRFGHGPRRPPSAKHDPGKSREARPQYGHVDGGNRREPQTVKNLQFGGSPMVCIAPMAIFTQGEKNSGVSILGRRFRTKTMKPRRSAGIGIASHGRGILGCRVHAVQ